MDIFAGAGYQIKLGWYGQPNPVELESHSGRKLKAEPFQVKDGILSVGSFIPDMIILNNDFSGGYPEDLKNVKQPIVPTRELGWHSRRKISHFKHYNQLAAEFAQILDFDPWLIQISTEVVEPVNFSNGQGLEQVASTVDSMMEKTRQELKEKIPVEIDAPISNPFVVVKSNSGTYGMGITIARSGEDILKINRRTKNKMSTGKGKSAIGSVIVQEGITTQTIVDQLAAEPVIYLMGTELVGGFLRTHTKRGTQENLNSPGMVLKKLCMTDLEKILLQQGNPNPSSDHQNQFHSDRMLEFVYGSVARLSALAAGLEIKEAMK